MPANAGIHVFLWSLVKAWIPAFAGMTAVNWSGYFADYAHPGAAGGVSASWRGWLGSRAGSIQQSATPRLRVQ